MALEREQPDPRELSSARRASLLVLRSAGHWLSKAGASMEELNALRHLYRLLSAYEPRRTSPEPLEFPLV